MKWQDCVPFLLHSWLGSEFRILNVVESQQRFAEHSSYVLAREHLVVRNRNPLKWLIYKRKLTGKEWDCPVEPEGRKYRNQGQLEPRQLCMSHHVSSLCFSLNCLHLLCLHKPAFPFPAPWSHRLHAHTWHWKSEAQPAHPIHEAAAPRARVLILVQPAEAKRLIQVLWTRCL